LREAATRSTGKQSQQSRPDLDQAGALTVMSSARGPRASGIARVASGLHITARKSGGLVAWLSQARRPADKQPTHDE